ncbi:MAG: methyltransferase domain-containing protein [Puniceicoccales bacterium]|jgi:malonyl-ACP O-methyltransferase BioC|nr:methyltransferase domain-containing protein [Puniceicoccales bacterium]
MKLSDLQIKNNFDAAAATYDQYASVQKKTSEYLAFFCSSFFKDPQKFSSENPQKILDIGSGTGFTTIAFQKYYRHAQYTLCDISENMIHIARDKVPNQNYIVNDAENNTFCDTYDLGISNLALQWFRDIESFLAKILLKCKYFAFSIPVKGSFSAYENLFAEKNIPILAHRYRDTDALLALVQKWGDVMQSSFKRHDLFFENAFDAAKHFKYVGAQSTTIRQNRAQIVARLLRNSVKINLNYDVFFVLLRGR